MDRRVFLTAGLALAGCGQISRKRATVVCDPALAAVLTRALTAWTKDGGTFELISLAPKALLERAETTPGLVVATREEKLADRLQRLGHVRLKNRWKPYVGDSPIQVLATMGAGEGDAVRLGKWLASDEAAPYLAATATPVIFTAP